MGELYYEISLQGQEVVDMCKICMGYIPAKKEIRPLITCREGQCLWEDKEVPREKPGALPRLCERTGLGLYKLGIRIAHKTCLAPQSCSNI